MNIFGIIIQLRMHGYHSKIITHIVQLARHYLDLPLVAEGMRYVLAVFVHRLFLVIGRLQCDALIMYKEYCLNSNRPIML